jgi:hypothetical protein
VPFVGVLLVGPLVLGEDAEEIQNVVVLFVSDHRLYLVEVYIALEKVFAVLTLIEFLEHSDILFDMCLHRNSQNVIKSIHVLLVI